MENKEKLYDELAVETGVVIEDNSIETIDGETAAEKIEEVNESLHTFAYGNNGPVPGENVSSSFDNISNVNKTDAISKLIEESARIKAAQEKAENEANRVLTPAEKAQRKKDVCEYLLRQQEEMFFMQNHYIMSGQQRRHMKKLIAKNYDKGMYTPKEDAVDLNK